jgi:hypothetical protein
VIVFPLCYYYTVSPGKMQAEESRWRERLLR